ncbi:cobalamin biosynthesis protein [Skermania sp. ID1734]|uniref:cobalamin biosynthesis protein n=1 Tax=Skermania sp. ID1734 TaxID=2597516 RepID=UPI00117CAE97|nr:cobalamin biosynthesis protein [Skermania sp. ID1734]TSD93556.1 cobalamin biosynthesis protein [Skermania sp. ID1734]
MPELIVGIGARPATPASDLLAAIHTVTDQPIAELATIDRRARESGVREAAASLGAEVVSFTAAELAQVPVATETSRTRDAVGTGSVAEAAALLAAGASVLATPRRTVNGVVVALALKV